MAVATVTVPVGTLQDFITQIFVRAGCAADEAERTTRHLLSANLTGHDSHGIIRVPRYIQLRGQIYFQQTIK